MTEDDPILAALNDDVQRTTKQWADLIRTERKAWPIRKKVWMQLRWKVGQPARRFPRRVVWFIQRGRRGWADCDLWNMDTHIARLNVEMLTELRRIAHGYPAGLEATHGDAGFEEWCRLLGEMIETWQAYLDHVDHEDGWDKAKADYEKFKVGLPLYGEWYSGLWD
jgi:hypothetical protein